MLFGYGNADVPRDSQTSVCREYEVNVVIIAVGVYIGLLFVMSDWKLKMFCANLSRKLFHTT